jgi:hypothetical protein
VHHENEYKTIYKDHSKVCPVRSMAIMVVRKGRLGHYMDLLVAIYVNNKGNIRYLTSNEVPEITRKAVRKMYPDM